MISTNWTRENLAWCGGLFEGEGNISFYLQGRKTDVLQSLISIGSTDEDVIRKFHQIIGMGVVYGPYKNKNYKPMWHWKVGRRDHALAFLYAIFPFLGKRRQEKTEKFIDFYQPLKRKHKGKK